MNLELIPVIIGVAVGLVGLCLVFDAWTADDILVKEERRRGPRLERSRKGEAMVGLGVISMASAFIGRDTWVYSIVAVIVGSVFLLLGAVASRKYLGEVIGKRGPMRRREKY